jgi:predicted nucleotidyltransferase
LLIFPISNSSQSQSVCLFEIYSETKRYKNNPYIGYYNPNLGYDIFKMDLIQFLKTNESSRKIFGERELKIIEKQTNGINLTQSEKNRLSRDIRKKLQFIKEISKFENEFNLKKAQSIKTIIQEAKYIILEHHLKGKIKRILLFGSFIENKLTIKSDIDLAIEFSDITEKQAFDFRKEISGQLSDKVDIQVFNFLPEKVKQSILKNNRVLFKHE